jgi:hypothetical protein
MKQTVLFGCIISAMNALLFLQSFAVNADIYMMAADNCGVGTVT